MTPGAPAAQLLGALLLLWLPASFPLSGPSTVKGIVGESLSLQCRYEEKFKANNKFWCRGSFVTLCEKIVETRDSEREMWRGRVSISDHPANLTFTVTLERLALEDAGTYLCGVDAPWWLDYTSKVRVSVFPAPTSGVPTDGAKTSTPRSKAPTASPTSLATEDATHGPTGQEDLHQGQGPGLSVLLALLAFLLLLLVGSSLLAWRMLQKRVRAGERTELPRSPRQAVEQSEPQYANLELRTRTRWEEPAPRRQEEVEYSLVKPPSDNLHYSSVVFDSQKQRNPSSANGILPRGQEEGPKYSVIRKPRDGLRDPRPCPP